MAAWAAASELHAGAYLAARCSALVSRSSRRSRPISSSCGRSRPRARIPKEEKEIFVLTGTLLWGIMIQELIAYFFTNNAKTVLPIVEGVVDILGVRTPQNEIFTAVVCWLVIGVAVAAGQPDAHRQGGAGGVDEPARRNAARASS